MGRELQPLRRRTACLFALVVLTAMVGAVACIASEISRASVLRALRDVGPSVSPAVLAATEGGYAQRSVVVLLGTLAGTAVIVAIALAVGALFFALDAAARCVHAVTSRHAEHAQRLERMDACMQLLISRASLLAECNPTSSTTTTTTTATAAAAAATTATTVAETACGGDKDDGDSDECDWSSGM